MPGGMPDPMPAPGSQWLSPALHDLWAALPPGGRPSRTLMGVMSEQGQIYPQGGGVHYEGHGGQAVLGGAGGGVQWVPMGPRAAPVADWTPHDLPMFRP